MTCNSYHFNLCRKVPRETFQRIPSKKYSGFIIENFWEKYLKDFLILEQSVEVIPKKN